MKKSAVGRVFLPLLGVLTLSACTDHQEVLLSPAEKPVASRAGAGAIPGRYIVVFKDDERDPAATAKDVVSRHGGTLHHTYTTALKGFAANLPDAAVAALQRNPKVAYVEEDQIGYLSAEQYGAVWGLDRIDSRARSFDGVYRYYQTGAGVTVYVLDSGIRTAHSEFGGRAHVGYDALGGTGQDCHGHGTHVAATVGGQTYGVAKGVQLVSVRVAKCDGSVTTSDVVAGLDWVARNRVLPAVANLSLGIHRHWYRTASSVDDAVRRTDARGVLVVAAAGNDNDDACGITPARVPAALTVGATNSSDARSSFSNYGPCVDIFAPGEQITSAWNGFNQDSRTISGTSMAAPHVAGVAALYWSTNPTAARWHIADIVTNSATRGAVTDPRGSPNRLVYGPHTLIRIIGPESLDVYAEDTHTWDAHMYGLTDASPSYLWEYRPTSSSPWTVVATSRTYSRFVAAYETFDLRATVTLGSESHVQQFSMQRIWDNPMTDCEVYGTNC